MFQNIIKKKESVLIKQQINVSPNGQVKNHTRENPGKGKNILSKPITTLHTAEINTLTDLKLHVEKQLEFSEYWHSEETFYVHQILDDECKRAKRCELCKVWQRLSSSIQKLVVTQLWYSKEGIYVQISTDSEKEENRFLRLYLEGSFIVPKRSAS